MQDCYITITTEADGTENTITRQGRWEPSVNSVKLHYCEENAQIFLQLVDGCAYIKRMGDYTLSLSLEEGKLLDGKIGIGGAKGDVQTYARKISYFLKKDSLLLSLHYDLIISNETQKMKLRLLVKNKENSNGGNI